MSVSEILIKLMGVVLAIVGFALLLSVVGVDVFGIHVGNMIVSIILGVCFLGAGIYIVRGGTIQI